MMFRIARRLPIVLIATAAGCMRVPADAGFSEIQNATEHRLPQQRVLWRTFGAADREADDAVASLLRQPLTVDAAVQIALLNNRSLQAEYESLAISQADLVQAGLLRNPVFGASVRFPDRSPRGTNVEFSLTQSFIDLLQLPARQRIASDEFEATKLLVAHRVIALAADVREAYFRAQAAEQSLELQRSAIEIRRLAFESAQRLHDAGNSNDVELHDHQALFEDAAAELSLAEADTAALHEQLSTLLGEPEPFVIAPQLPAPVASSFTAPGLERRAIAQRFDLAASRKNIEGIARSLGLSEQSRWLADAQLGVDTEHEPDGQWVTGPTFAIPIPLFDQGQATIARAHAQLRQARQRYAAALVQVRSDVRTALFRLSSAQARSQRVNESIVPLRHRIVEESQRQYNGMLVSIFELLRRRQDELDAQRLSINAQRDYWLARAELERAIGGDLPEPSGASTHPFVAPNSQPAPHDPQQSHQHHGE